MSHPTALYVEDEPNDVLFMRYAWRKAGLQNPLEILPDGQEAIRHLSGDGPYANRARHPFPDVLILDLKLPKMTGLEVLTWIRARPDLQRLRVVVFSSSSDPVDINAAHALRVDLYLVKPAGLEGWTAMVETLAEHWLRARES